MGTSLRQSRRQLGPGLVSPYIEFIGTHERPSHDLPRLASRSPIHASFLIGQSCFLLVQGHDKTADPILRQVRDQLRPLGEEKITRYDESESMGRHLFHLAVLLLDRDDQIAAAQTFQESTYQRAVNELAQISPPPQKGKARRNNNLGKGLVGKQSELLMTGFAARDLIGTLAIQSLVHHDQGAYQPKNYDFILVSNNGDLDRDPTLTSDQLKNGCLDYCKDQEGGGAAEKVRAQYGRHIAVIAGHCDIHDGVPDLWTQRLHNELLGRADSKTVAMLDARTQQLHTTLTNPEPWRMGMVRIQ